MPREGSLYGWYWYLPAEAEFVEDWFQGSLPGTTFTAEWSEPVGDWTVWVSVCCSNRPCMKVEEGGKTYQTANPPNQAWLL